MKSRITDKPAENKPKRKKGIETDDDLTIEDLIEMGLVDENTKINAYPKSARNVINHNDE